MIDLTGKSALISGGSRGIGAATAVLFARAGADVAFTYTKHRKDAVRVVERVEALGRNALAIQGNVAKEDHVRRFVQTTVGCFGKVDILVNNAGIWTYGAIGKMNRKVWDDTVDINQTGTFLLCNAVVPHMRKRKYGRIVNVSSTAGQRGEPHHSHYAATKGAIIAFTKSLAAEL
ncbi:MAG: SDR family NAD(P)-dependent oxidoreductase, partial [Bacteroidota bacterium]